MTKGKGKKFSYYNLKRIQKKTIFPFCFINSLITLFTNQNSSKNKNNLSSLSHSSRMHKLQVTFLSNVSISQAYYFITEPNRNKKSNSKCRLI